jgi:hypothetical protein
MTGTTILAMLFGAALVAVGVLSAALADRIRGIRSQRERPITAPRTVRTAQPIEVIEPELVTVPTKPPRRAEAKIQQPIPVEGHMANDVIAALVAAGYKKTQATEAAWGCNTADRTSIEAWVTAALRRCAQGGAS